jgi:hypothetical protein
MIRLVVFLLSLMLASSSFAQRGGFGGHAAGIRAGGGFRAGAVRPYGGAYRPGYYGGAYGRPYLGVGRFGYTYRPYYGGPYWGYRYPYRYAFGFGFGPYWNYGWPVYYPYYSYYPYWYPTYGYSPYAYYDNWNSGYDPSTYSVQPAPLAPSASSASYYAGDGQWHHFDGSR